MPLTPSSVTRSTDPSGDAIKTLRDADDKLIQVGALADENGDQTGIPANPLTVEGTVEVGTFPSEYPLPDAQVTALTPPTPQTDALTDTQLRASAVAVSAASLPLPAGATTETTLLAVKAGTQLAGYNVNDVDAVSAALTYVGKEDKDGNWLVQKITVTGTPLTGASSTNIAWATVTNNPAVLLYSTAWAARASTLVYGTYSQAF